MEPADSSPPPRDTSEQNSMPSQNGESETWVEDLKKVAKGLDLGERLSSKIRETTSTIFEFSLQWEEYEKGVELKEKLFTERFVELKKREELVEERESKVELAEASISERLSALEDKENECDMKQFLEDNVMREVKEKHGEMIREFDARENELRLLDETISEKSNELEKKVVDFRVKQHDEVREIEVRREFLEFKEKELEERESKVELAEASISERLSALEEKENECDKKQFLGDKLMREVKEKHGEVMREFDAREIELRLLDETISEKSNALEKKVVDFKVKQHDEVREIEVRREFVELKEKELEERESKVELAEASISERLSALEEKNGELMREFDAREIELRLLDETTSEKSNALEKKVVDFQVKQHDEVREIEVRREFLELKEKELEEREKKLELKQREVEERSTNAETCKRSRVESVLTNKGRDSESLIPPAKKHKSITELYGAAGEEKSVLPVKRSFATASEHTSEAKRREAYEIVCIDQTDDEDPEPFTCPDPDFNDFNNEMSSFAVDQIWALYDPIDDMPRYYAQIMRVLKDMSLRVRWLESVQTTEHEKMIPVACGRFKYGKTENKSLLMFSHKMNHIRRGKIFTIIPRKGETWALFTDWTKTWNSHREQHKPPYKYDFVEVLSEFDSDHGIGVAYLGRVEGFTSVYKPAAQHGIVQSMIGSDELFRFSHRVPSVKLTGDEEEGVPAGYFELDPAAIPRAYLKDTKVEEKRLGYI